MHPGILIFDYILGLIMWTLITPKFLIKPMVPLYVAWFFYMFRFYLMPYILGYSVLGMLSFPLESEITEFLVTLFSKQH